MKSNELNNIFTHFPDMQIHLYLDEFTIIIGVGSSALRVPNGRSNLS